ncbi:hypothetical protein [Luteimonas aquatica]|uniref:hypothetical protein n=1 Tax=Luteimonas aquatica TaxID=450364 RepID=UPI001F58F82A|nr:hypothetical protein [Luteimonas aquatica]
MLGEPHSVVVAGIRGDLADPAAAQVHIFNPWDTRVAFDNDPLAFNVANNGYETWVPFDQFAADFAEIAGAGQANWRVLHLPAQTALAQSLAGGRRRPPPRGTRAVAAEADGADTGRWPDPPAPVVGARQRNARGRSAGGGGQRTVSARSASASLARVPRAGGRRRPPARGTRAFEAEADGADTVRWPDPPAPVVRALQRMPRALNAAVVEIASAVVGATMERVMSDEGDVTWELDQLRGYKHPNDVAPSPLPPASDATPIRLTDWPKGEIGFGVTDEISAGFEINWQYNGKSVGNVLISNIATNDAVGWGLSVKAKIMDDNIVYPRDNPSFAALRIRFEYHFRGPPLVSDKIAIRDVRLFGDGTYSDEGRWEQT